MEGYLRLERVVFQHERGWTILGTNDAPRWERWILSCIGSAEARGESHGPSMTPREVSRHCIPKGHLPSSMEPSREYFEALGFQFGSLHECPAFTEATLPMGWRISMEPSGPLQDEQSRFIRDDRDYLRVVIWFEKGPDGWSVHMAPVVRTLPQHDPAHPSRDFGPSR